LSVPEYFGNVGLYKYLGYNLFFMNFLHPTLPGVFYDTPVNGALWTIKVEVMFYICVPVIVYFLRKLKKLKKQNIFLLSMYILAIFYRNIFKYLGNRTGSAFVADLGHQLPGFMQYFSFGIFALLNYNILRKHERILIFPSIIIFIIYYITKIEYLFPIGLGILIMFSAFNFSKLNSIGKEVDFSYGIYIYHFPIIQLLVSIGIFNCNRYVAVLLVLGSVFSLSYISWQFLERKFLGR
jgi:peptidoglycan/LPS O-acetylase OafA/YrhL